MKRPPATRREVGVAPQRDGVARSLRYARTLVTVTSVKMIAAEMIQPTVSFVMTFLSWQSRALCVDIQLLTPQRPQQRRW